MARLWLKFIKSASATRAGVPFDVKRVRHELVPGDRAVRRVAAQGDRDAEGCDAQ